MTGKQGAATKQVETTTLARQRIEPGPEGQAFQPWPCPGQLDQFPRGLCVPRAPSPRRSGDTHGPGDLPRLRFPAVPRLTGSAAARWSALCLEAAPWPAVEGDEPHWEGPTGRWQVPPPSTNASSVQTRLKMAPLYRDRGVPLPKSVLGCAGRLGDIYLNIRFNRFSEPRLSQKGEG